jgi:cysteine-rich repeat protein
VTLLVVGCGGGAGGGAGSSGADVGVCGNGKIERGEDCDDGDRNGTPGDGCSATCTYVLLHPTTVQVAWHINYMAAPMFSDEACYTVVDPGFQAVVKLSFAGMSQFSGEGACNDGSKMFVDQPVHPLPPGDYTVTAKLVERSTTEERDLTSEVTTKVSALDGEQVDALVNFPSDKFVHSYTGDLFFTTASWGDTGGSVRNSCAGAGINKVRLWLRRRGSVVPGAQTVGQPAIALDGSMIIDCHTPTGSSDSYHVQALDWGNYEVVVGGYQGGNLVFCGPSPVFVGAGGANPTYQLTTTQATGATCP